MQKFGVTGQQRVLWYALVFSGVANSRLFDRLMYTLLPR